MERHSGTLITIAINGIFEDIETLLGKCLHIDDLALFYSAEATGMIWHKLQGAIDTLLENANNIGFSFSAAKMTCVHFCQKRRRHLDLTSVSYTHLDVYKRQERELFKI